MSIAPATRQAFQTLHNVQPQQLEQTLRRAAQNDAGAWSELQQKTGISDAGQIAQAVEAFRTNSFEGLLGANYQSRTSVVTGGNAPSTFSPSQGGVGASRMDQMINMRSGGGVRSGMAQLGQKLKGMNEEIKGHQAEKAELVVKKGTLETELSGLTLNRRERWFGGALAGVLGGDSDKAAKGKALRKEIESVSTSIAHQDKLIAAVPVVMKDAVIGHLRATRDPDFAVLDEKFGKARDAFLAAKAFLSTIDDAKSAVSSAIFYEQNESVREQSGQASGPNSNYMSDSANQTANTALQTVNRSHTDFRDAMRDYGQHTRTQGLSTTSTGDDLDRISDMVSGNLGGQAGSILGRLGSAMVLNNLRTAESELSSLENSVSSIKRRVGGELDVAQSARDGYIASVQADALAMV